MSYISASISTAISSGGDIVSSLSVVKASTNNWIVLFLRSAFAPVIGAINDAIGGDDVFGVVGGEIFLFSCKRGFEVGLSDVSSDIDFLFNDSLGDAVFVVVVLVVDEDDDDDDVVVADVPSISCFHLSINSLLWLEMPISLCALSLPTDFPISVLYKF